MKKHTITAGPIGMRRIRSLVTFRHENSFARLLSAFVAVAMAMFLVVGTGTAYAEEDAQPAGTTTEATAEEPAEESAEEPAEDPAPEEPAEEPTPEEPAEDPAPEEPEEPQEPEEPAGSEDESAEDDAPGPVMSALTTLAKGGGPSINLVGNAACEDGSGTLVGGFEIDGDPCDEDGIDFNDGPGDSVDDPFGADDPTTFTGGSSENTDPATWSLNGPKPAGKADIGTVWAYSANVGGTVYAYFGFTNDSTSGGTQDYSLEYNQADPVDGLPVRTPGDLLFHFFSGGNDVLDYEASYIYRLESDPLWNGGCVEVGTLNAGWCPKDLPAGAFVSATSATGEFVEGSIDISAMFGAGNCSGTFGTTFLRSAPGAFWTSQMKDYVAPLDVTTPSTCGKLVINKTDFDTDAPVAGAVFAIEGDPRPDGDPNDVYCVFDGIDADKPAQPAECDIYVADGTADGTVTIDPVEPGTYTVTEVVAPPGYLLKPEPDPGNSFEVTVGESETETVDFTNHKQWQPLDISKTADGTFSALYTWAIDKEIAPTALGPWSDGTTPGDPLVKDVETGGNTNLYYRVVVTEEEKTTSDFVVSGAIDVDNPNDAAVTATISESLTGCVITHVDAVDVPDQALPWETDVPAGGAEYSYTCDLGDGPADPGTNTATVTWDRSDYPQTTADLEPANADEVFSEQDSDGYTFVETVSVDETITVTDDHFDFGGWTITWGDEVDGTYESAVYSFDTEAADGTCSDVITNTATITGDESTLDQDSESGQVCVEVDLSVDVTSLETLTRSFQWDIDKTTTTPADEGPINVENGEATAHYSVTVTALPYEDAGWDMYGTVTITNPNAFTDKQVSDLDIAYSGGGTCEPTEALPIVAAGGSAEVDFDCDFVAQPAYDGEVTVTVEWDAGSESASDPTPWQVAEADWLVDATLVNQDIVVYDDHAVGDMDEIATLDWQDVWDAPEHQVTVEYDYTFSGDDLPVLGECDDEVINTAWFVGDDPEVVLGEDDAVVAICNPYALVQALKVDFETQEPLAGATFELFDGDTSLGTAISGDDGLAKFDAKLVAGTYTIVETQAPAGYGAPINEEGTVEVTITADDLDNEVLAPITFRNPGTGQIETLPKEQFERDGLDWVPSDGIVDFTDEIRYVISVESTGTRQFHDVTLTDYVPGYNPADVTTAPAGTKAELDVDSITCGGGITCTSEVDMATGLITWHLTEIGEADGVFDGDASGWVEFVVRMPDIPGTSPIQDPGTVFAAALWNQAYLDWEQMDFTQEEPALAPAHLDSNEVVVAASATLPPEVVPPTPPLVSPPTPPALPNTGGPNSWLLGAGLLLLLGGGTLVAGDRLRKRRS